MKKDNPGYSHNLTEYVGPHVLAYWIKSSIRNDMPMKKKCLIETDKHKTDDYKDNEHNNDDNQQ